MTSTPGSTPSRKQYALFIGRWQPFHAGHEWLIRQKLDKGIPCLIAVRDCGVSEANPQPAFDVMCAIQDHFWDQPGVLPAEVQVIVIPDIESVNYGRGVGYEVNEHIPPPEIHEISATEIRSRGV